MQGEAKEPALALFNFPNEDYYIGEYRAAPPRQIARKGVGRYITADGNSYSGLWAEDMLEVGAVLFSDHTTYQGCFKDGKYSDDSGTYTLPNAGEMMGAFEENLPTGDLVFFDKRGFKWKGTAAASQDLAIFHPVNHFLGSAQENKGAPHSSTEEESKGPLESKDESGGSSEN